MEKSIYRERSEKTEENMLIVRKQKKRYIMKEQKGNDTQIDTINHQIKQDETVYIRE